MFGVLSGRKFQPLTRPYSSLHPITKIQLEVMFMEVTSVQKHTVNLLAQQTLQQRGIAQRANVMGLQGTVMKFGGPYAARTMSLQGLTGSGMTPNGGGGGGLQGGGGGGLVFTGGGGGGADTGDELDFIEDDEGGVISGDVGITETDSSPASMFGDTQVGAGLVPTSPVAGGGWGAAGSGLITVAAQPAVPGFVSPAQPGLSPFAPTVPGGTLPTLPTPGTMPTYAPVSETIYDRVDGFVFYSLLNKAPFRMIVEAEICGRFSDFELFRTKVKKDLPGRGGVARYKSAFAIAGEETQSFMRDLLTDWGQDSKIVLVVDAVIKWMNNTHRISDARDVPLKGMG